MKNILQNLQGQDKLKHSKWGNIILLLTFTASLILLNVWQALCSAFLVLLCAALSKELYDKYIKKTFIDWYDIVAAFVPYPIIKKVQNL
jgi:hypothetical protein